jgi:hypothetical protein
MANSYKSEMNSRTDRFSQLIRSPHENSDLDSDGTGTGDSDVPDDFPSIDHLFHQFPEVAIDELIEFEFTSIPENTGEARIVVDTAFFDWLFRELQRAQGQEDISALLPVITVLSHTVRLSVSARHICFEMLDVLMDLARTFFASFDVRHALIDVAVIAALYSIRTDRSKVNLSGLKDLLQVQVSNLQSELSYDDVRRVLTFFREVFLGQDVFSAAGMLSECEMQIILDAAIFHLSGEVDKDVVDLVLCTIKNMTKNDQVYWSMIMSRIEEMEFPDVLGQEKLDLRDALTQKMTE